MRRFILIIAFFTGLLFLLPYTSDAYELGDLNSDGIVDCIDVVHCMNDAMDIEDLGIAADVNGDGIVDIQDVIIILDLVDGGCAAFSVLTYDKDLSWSIEDFELLDAIDEWALGNLGDFDLLDLIDYWAVGSYCWDSTTASYKAGACGDGLPPDPEDVASEIDPTVATNMFTATEFLFTGSAPIQTGVADGTMEALRVAVLRGMVKERDGNPIPGVTINILNHPEFGQTLTRADGIFDMAVNGGGLLTVTYQKSGYLTAQRQMDVPWRDYARLPDVVMVPLDTQVTTIDLTSSDPMQVATGSEVTDDDGTRRAVLLLPQGTTAEMVMPDGSTQPISTLNVRATEYTVGDSGLEAMPASLPPASQYTYAVELSADEAIAAGATDVRFNQALYFYVEDFIGFPVGGAVPTGYYDKQQGQWIASENGRVIKILSITGILADLDTDGDDAADDAATLAALGINDAEREQLAALYDADQSLWRVPMTHFTPWDCNWPFGPPPYADYPKQRKPSTRRNPAQDEEDNNPESDADPCDEEGSIIECLNRVLGQRLPVSGTPLTLNYRSDRVEGEFTEKYTARISLTGDTYPPGLKEVRLNIDVVGQRFSESFDPAPNLSYTFQWDGLDIYNRKVQGSVTAIVKIIYVYDAYYYPVSSEFEQSFGQPGKGVYTVRARDLGLVYMVQIFTVQLYPFDIREQQGFGGWSLNLHHSYDPNGRVLELGDGSTRSIAGFNGNVIYDVAGNGTEGYSGDGGPALEAQLNSYAIAFSPDGSYYLADGQNNTIRRVGLDGIITTVAGNGTYGYSGDGGPATEAQLYSPYGIAIAPDGSFYIGDRNNYRVRRVGTDGIITTVAGNGEGGYSGDGGPATEAQLYEPTGIAIAPDGSLYIGDRYNRRVRRVGTDGIITTVAGNGTYGSSGDGGPATEAQLKSPARIAVGPDGSLYITDTNSNRVHRVGTDGIITTVAGTGTYGYSGDGGLATEARLHYPGGVAIGPDGKLYIADTVNNRIRVVNQNGIINTMAGGGDSENYDWAMQVRLNLPHGVTLGPNGEVYVADTYNYKIRRISSPMPGVSADDIFIPSADGNEVYHFDVNGRHLRTLNSLNGLVFYQFDYDANGYLVTIEDGDGKVTSIERNMDSSPNAIVGPYGRRTEFTLDANGYLATINGPEGNSFAYQYTSGGLLTQETDPEGNVSIYTYNDWGRLERADAPDGGYKELVRTDEEYGYEVAVTTAEGRTTTYWVGYLPAGDKQLINSFPNGLSNAALIGTDGTSTITYYDGTVVTELTGPDPRWGMQAPLTKSVTMTTPDGLQNVIEKTRVVTFANPSDPMSVETLTNTITINGQIYTSQYDAVLSQITTTTPEGRKSVVTLGDKNRIVAYQYADLAPTNITYDDKGRIVEITRGSADKRVHRINYDADGNMGTYTDPLGRSYGLEHDGAGRTTRITLPGGRVVDITYNAKGEIVSVIPPGKVAHSFTYAPNGQYETYTPPGMGTQTQFTYNLDRQPVSIFRQGSEVISYGYDTSGRPNTITLPRGQVSLEYDPLSGNPSLLTTPDGGTLTLGWDGSLPTNLTWAGDVSGDVAIDRNNDFLIVGETVNDLVSFEYDTDGLLILAGDLSLTRDPNTALVTGTALGNITTSGSYSDFIELEDYSASYSATQLYAVNYFRNKLGRIMEKTETIEGVTDTYVYQYDLADRLISVDMNGSAAAGYTYDDNGNRLSYTAGGTTLNATHDLQDRLLTYGDFSYGYTDNGELLTRTENTEVTTYDYGPFGNLMSVELPDGTQIEYLVDGKNRRIGKKVNGTLVQGFLYKDTLKLIAEMDGSNDVVSRFIYTTRPNVPDYMVKNGTTYRIISDHLGSVRLVVDAGDGAVVQRIDYDEYGNVLSDSNVGFQPFGFAGGLYDPDTELVRFGARDYDPYSGRWTTKDPILFFGGDTNLYGYVLGDPVNRTDPEGLSSLKDMWCAMYNMWKESEQRRKNCMKGAWGPHCKGKWEPGQQYNDLLDLVDTIEDLAGLLEELDDLKGDLEDMGFEFPDLPLPVGTDFLTGMFGAGSDALSKGADIINERNRKMNSF